jgi:hypothetical protein
MTTTDIPAQPLVTPNSFSLGQNYPNPFNPTTSIPFSLQVGGNVRITIYNTLGQKVAEVANQVFTPGNHVVSFNARELASGVYFYMMEAEGFIKARKLLLIK